MHALDQACRYALPFVGGASHRDSGYVTVLYMTQCGLEILRDEAWRDVPPKEGYLLVLFGATLQLLLTNRFAVSAPTHRIRQIVEPGRLSFAAFAGPSEKQNVYCLDRNNTAVVHKPASLFVENVDRLESTAENKEYG